MRTTFFAGAVLALVVSPATAQTQSVAGQPVMRAPAQPAAKPSAAVKQSKASAAKPPRAPTAKAASTPEFAFGGSASAFRRSGLR